MQVEVKNLDDLMRLKNIGPATLSELTGISEATIRRRLEDHDWRMSEAECVVKALEIPENYVYAYFFEPLLEKTQTEGT